MKGEASHLGLTDSSQPKLDGVGGILAGGVYWYQEFDHSSLSSYIIYQDAVGKKNDKTGNWHSLCGTVSTVGRYKHDFPYH